MNVDEFAAWLADEVENFRSTWEEEAALDPVEFPHTMLKREWLDEFKSGLLFE